MKRTLIAAALALSALALAACGRGYTDSAPSDGYRIDFPGSGSYAYVNVWRDPVTGCESYLTDDGFMSPRLNADGTQRCTTEAPQAG